ncbi:MAG: nucleotide exchange factor GrpE [Coriobacteriales bacterium]|jgi:molecular chaperone GrpE
MDELHENDQDVVAEAEEILEQAAAESAVGTGDESAPTDADNVAEAQVEDPAAEVAEWQDKYLRLQAEWDNFRKRTAAERADERSRAAERLVTDLLPVVDDLERAIDNAGVADDDPMLEGIRAVYNKFTDILGRQGLVAVAPESGEAFDIHTHQAVSTVEDASVPAESIAQVYQKGYLMGEKLLRPAMVVTTTGGGPRQAPAED